MAVGGCVAASLEYENDDVSVLCWCRRGVLLEVMEVIVAWPCLALWAKVTGERCLVRRVVVE